MKCLILFFTFVISLTSCVTNYPKTSFYVKNTSAKTLNFKASIGKYSAMEPSPYRMTLPFTVLPHDSVLVRHIGFKRDAKPTAWFTSFTIFPSDSVQFNDPTDPGNWLKSADQKGRPVYTFTMNK